MEGNSDQKAMSFFVSVVTPLFRRSLWTLSGKSPIWAFWGGTDEGARLGFGLLVPKASLAALRD